MNRYSTVQRPEAALQRANDFISVGKEADALNALSEVIKERRQKQWSEIYEEIMMKYVELCVRLRNSALAKDGLFQYRVFTQQVSVQSLKNVVEKFLSLAEQRTEEAQKASIERVEEIDDLDVADAPENLLLSVVSGADTQDRMDRTVLSPWLRFLWDSYRNCLDMLRNNILVEEIYHNVARQSFAFCAKYQRRNEFHKLCDLLRIHLTQIQKSQMNQTEYRHTDYRVKLNSLESLSLMQETRQIQLNTAIQMELWQEAYKSAEDLHNIMQLSKDKDRRMVKPANYVNYYDKLALIFWKGGNILFHSAALLQKFIIYKDMKRSFTDEEAVEQATRVLLATLSIPHGADTSTILTKLLDIEDQHLTNIRVLSSLLRLPVAPTRAGLIKELALLNIPDQAVEPVRKIYNLLELEFSPLRLASKIKVALESLEQLGRDDYSQYITELKSIVATRVLRQLTVIYDSLSLDRFEKIIPFFTRAELEHFLVQTSKHRSVKAKINHRDNCVYFYQLDLTLAGGIEVGLDIDAASNGIEYVREHLCLLHDQLREAVYTLDNHTFQQFNEEQLRQAIEEYLRNKDAEYDRILKRRRLIETYKETSETQRREKIQQQQEEHLKREEKRRAEEIRRLEEQNKENEKKRAQAERDEIQQRQKADQLRRFQQNPMYQQIIKERGEDVIMNMDPELVLKEQRERMDVERRETQNKLRQQEKNFDYMVRAHFLEEIKFHKQMSDDYHSTACQRHDESERNRVERAIEEHQRDIMAYDDLRVVKDQVKEFLRGRIEVHHEDFERRQVDWQKRLEVEKKRRLMDRKAKRKLERQQQAEKDRREREESAKELAAQAERDKKEMERQQTREMLQRVREKERERDRANNISSVRSELPSQWRRENNSDRMGSSNQRPLQQQQSTALSAGGQHYMPPSSNADTSNWRAGPRDVVHKTASSVSASQSSTGFKPRPSGAYMPPQARQQHGGGGVDSRNQPPSQQQPPAQNSAPTAGSGTGKYVPPALRRRMEQQQ